jgi:hypothetical protein
MPVLMRTLAVLLLTVFCVVAPVLAAQNAPSPSQPPKPQSEYVPIEQLPPQDQLPAAPLLISAYSFVMIVFFLYVLSLARRLTNVQRDVDRLGATLKHTGKP